MANIKLAEKLYRQYHGRQGVWMGPFLPKELGNSDSDRRFFDINLRLVLDEIIIKNEGKEIIAPSPWHAALYLRQYCMRGHASQTFIFRGQGLIRWSLSTKISRRGINKTRSRSETKLLCDIASRYFPFNGLRRKGRSNIHVATAQHYQIPTCLLDFSLDPSVAIYFASTSTAKGQGIVYFIDLEKIERHGCRILLPPPFVERLYKQSGLFIEDPKKNYTSLKQDCITIKFPKDDKFVCFRNGAVVDLEEDQIWLRSVVDFCKKYADKVGHLAVEEWPADIKREFFCIELPDFIKDQQSHYVQWASTFQDFLYWCVFYFEPEGEFASMDNLELICRGNPVIAELVAEIYSLTKEGPSAPGRSRLSAAMREFISREVAGPICGI